MNGIKARGIPTCRLSMDGHFLNELGQKIPASEAEKCHIIHSHPEGLLNTSTGEALLNGSWKCGTLVYDECHIIEEW